MSTGAGARLLEIDPDLGRFLTAEELREAEHVTVPIRLLPTGQIDIDVLLKRWRAFSAIVIDGMLLDRLQLGDQAALRLLGPGDMLSLSGPSPSMLIRHVDGHAATRARVALLGNEVLHAARHWPGIVAGLHVRMSDQADRTAAQLAICQLPRVDRRLLAMMWLLAESWGQVKSIGTTLPLSLTHDVLGEMVGARRPTVTIALGELAESGAVVRQDRGWLLVEPPPPSTGVLPRIEQPTLLSNARSAWATSSSDERQQTQRACAELTQTVARLRLQYEQDMVRHRHRLERVAITRARNRRIRVQIRDDQRRR